MRKVIELAEGDTILTSFAEETSGPGWKNTPVWVVIQDRNGKCRVEAVQPDDQTAEMSLLYRISEAAHRAMKRAAKDVCRMPSSPA